MKQYCESIWESRRAKTREVMVGNVGVGGRNPVRIQSMTTSNTRDVDATVEQILRLRDAGCEIVRVTVQGMKEAEACEAIKNSLIQRGCDIPLVADIHFFPPAAMRVVDFVDKVRINPGNYADKRATFKTIEYNDASYADELVKIEEKFTPLVLKCKSLKRAMRIGTNHGSLSDRIMNRYGDTPAGMVESAFEFTRICRKHDFHDIIFSMKASNPLVMIQAYRLLAAEMRLQGWDYPLHLGVTEAGLGEDGRIKSAIGIGSLLLDGIGDTIRVSLTEDPWYEIDPCKRLVEFAAAYQGKGIAPFAETFRNFETIRRREVILPRTIGLHRDGSVLLQATPEAVDAPDFYEQAGCKIELGSPKPSLASADSLIVPRSLSVERQGKLAKLSAGGIGLLYEGDQGQTPQLLSLAEALQKVSRERFVVNKAVQPFALKVETQDNWESIETLKPALILLAPAENRLHFCRHFFEWLQSRKLPIPVILNFAYDCPQEDLILCASAEIGTLLADGLGEGICIEGEYPMDLLRSLSFGILQATRMRIFKTDFISCPSCGRTLFDLQDVTKRIRSRTAHLPGVKIAIMGCIVNGPGEMADADFGYVGSKPGKIDLYVGKSCVEKDIDFSDADDRLIALIKHHGRWVEKE